SSTWDDVNRASTLTFPSGIRATYSYDEGKQLSSVSYSLGANTLGALAYTYDASGNRTSVDGSWARTILPQALTSATYDAANRTASWGGQVFSYDRNGNLGSDGLTSYLWNARDQLTTLTGGAAATFQYDAFARRRSRATGTTTSFLYDGLNVVQELSGGTPTANLLTRNDLD